MGTEARVRPVLPGERPRAKIKLPPLARGTKAAARSEGQRNRRLPGAQRRGRPDAAARAQARRDAVSCSVAKFPSDRWNRT